MAGQAPWAGLLRQAQDKLKGGGSRRLSGSAIGGNKCIGIPATQYSFLKHQNSIGRLVKKFEKDFTVKPYIDLTHLIEEGMLAWSGATSGDQGTHDPWERHLHPSVDLKTPECAVSLLRCFII
jgi:hypothetical protein